MSDQPSYEVSGCFGDVFQFNSLFSKDLLEQIKSLEQENEKLTNQLNEKNEKYTNLLNDKILNLNDISEKRHRFY